MFTLRASVIGLSLILGLSGQQGLPDHQASTSVPRLLRINNTFHPANGLPAAPVESVTLSVYSEETGGTRLWQETQNVNVDAEGHYSALMGSTLNSGVPMDLFSSGESRWLGIQINRSGETEQQRIRLAAVPYALKASDAETLGGLPASAFMLAPGAGSGNSSGNSATGASGSAGLSVTSAGKLKPRADIGSTNCIGVFTDPTDVGCSAMWQSGSNIGIGTTVPGASLDIQTNAAGFQNILNVKSNDVSGAIGAAGVQVSHQNSTMLMRAYSTGAPGLLVNSIAWFAQNGTNKLLIGHTGTSPGNDVHFFTNNQWNNPQFTLTKAGNVGIGTTVPGASLDIQANAAGFQNILNIKSNDVSGAVGAAGVQVSHQNSTMLMRAYSTGAPGLLVNSIAWFAQNGTNKLLIGHTGTSPGNDVHFFTNNQWSNPQFTLTSAGNVGIGTTTPAATLEVNGNAQVDGNLSVTGNLNLSGVQGTANTQNGAALSGVNTSNSGGFPVGVQGTVNGAFGAGVSGSASQAGASGVNGYNSGASGFAVGVNGGTNSPNGAGVFGANNAIAGGGGAGVQGNTSVAGNYGVAGFNNATSGFAVGVTGGTASNNGAGVQGNASVAGAAGVNGFNSGTSGFAVGVNGGTRSPNGAGVFGSNNATTAAGGAGVQGNANLAGNSGVAGFNNATSGFAVGVTGGTASNNGAGVAGNASVAGAAGVSGFNSAATGFAVGVSGGTASNSGAGVQGNASVAGAVGVNGFNSATSGFAMGVSGGTSSPNGSGVFGVINSATAGGGAGVQGSANLAGNNGVGGFNSAASGFAVGVQGGTASSSGAGVQGNANVAGAVGVNGFNGALSGYAVGVSGGTASTNGAGVSGNSNRAGVFGVVGFNSANSGNAIGTEGASSSPGGVGVWGVSMACSPGNPCTLVPGTAGQFQTATTGILLQGISGTAGANTGTATEVFRVDGQGQGSFAGGVIGTSNQSGPSSTPSVVGLNAASSGFALGAAGVSGSPAGVGIGGLSGTCITSTCSVINGTAGAFYSSNNNGGFLLKGFSGPQGSDFLSGTSQVFSVDGQGNMTLAGNLTVTGNVSKGGGSFRIDHPLDPENKYLYHSFVESPDMMNIYDGIAILDERGEATVTLPEWFEALNQDFRYQLTCVGGYAPVYVASEVSGNQFRVAGGRSGLKVSWQLTGIRHDAYANAHRIQVEVEKPASERGGAATQLGSGLSKATGGGQ